MIKNKKKELLALRKGLCIAFNSALLTFLTGCGTDTRIDNIEDYYLLRRADESGTQTNIIYIKGNTVRNPSDESFVEGWVYSYNDTYYEKGVDHVFETFSPIQFISYSDVIEKDTYYECNVKNNDENLETIPILLENYAFPTHMSYTFGKNIYDYQCHVYEIEDKQANTKSYVVGYPVIAEETSPTQIYNALNASFIYLKTSEFATQIPSKLDEMDAFTLEEGHAILDEIVKENQGMARTLTPEE